MLMMVRLRRSQSVSPAGRTDGVSCSLSKCFKLLICRKSVVAPISVRLLAGDYLACLWSTGLFVVYTFVSRNLFDKFRRVARRGPGVKLHRTVSDDRGLFEETRAGKLIGCNRQSKKSNTRR